MNYQNLSDKELLSILIKERTNEDISERLLVEFKSLPEIFVNSEVAELVQIHGLGETRANLIKAIYELARRLTQMQTNQIQRIGSPADAAKILIPEMSHLKFETMKVVFLNTKNHVLAIETTSIGSLSSSIVHPREVYRLAIKKSAASIIVCHNHPSGDVTPSSEDISITKRLYEVGRLVGIELLDHLIIGNGTFLSLKEKGHI